ncbi:MAG: alanine racemase [Candidatus Margulisiibacteriota bacterium]
MEPFRPTRAEINLKAVDKNIESLRSFLGKGTRLMAIVKANAYGHGAKEIALAAEKAGADYLGVAYLGEALELRSCGVKTPILILSETPPSFADHVVEHDITQTVYTVQLAQSLSRSASRQGKKAKVHLKVDTGMGRVGVFPSEVMGLLKNIAHLPFVEVEGIFTHFSCGEDLESGFAKKQLDSFMSVLDQTKKEGFSIPIKYCANSAAVFNFPKSHLDMVRLGITMYGLYPPGLKRCPVALQKVLTLKTKVLYIKRVPKGTPLSYGATYVTQKETSIATLPVGYADGLSRLLSNRGQVLIRGNRYPIVGRVTMDMTMVETGDDKIEVWDDVSIIGKDGSEEITADEVAGLMDSINYEVVCGIGKRVPRVYIR